ncbi:MAG: hypothetical protein AB7E70_19570 [Hyphomicrobiaceae bacterium]
MISRSRLYLLAVRCLGIVSLLGIAACAIVAAIDYSHFRAWLIGAITGGPIVALIVRIVEDHHTGVMSARMPVVGRDISVPRAVLRERMPAGPAVPTRWRNERGHRRYGIGGGE